MVRRTSTERPLRRPRCSWPRVASRRFICETARWTAARSWVGLVGRARSSSASGREGGRVEVRSIRSRSSSRRRWRSKRLSWSRSIGGISSPPSSSAGCGPVERPRVRRMRWTSTPTTPEPSPWRPKAAIASRARSRISPSSPSRIASRIWSRSSSMSRRSAPSCRCSPSPISRSTASASAIRKNQRSNSSSNRRRSSCDFAIVAASASRKSSCEVQGTCSRAANASRISEVPTATPSDRSSSQKPSSFGARPGGPVWARGP